MMVTFRCKRSGNTVKFYDEGDIAGLRAHDGYEEVIENGKETESSKSYSGNSHESKDDGKKRETNAGNEKRKENEGQVLAVKIMTDRLIPIDQLSAKKRGRKPKK